MTRDYKSARARSSGGLSGTAGLLLGLAIGLGVALAVFVYDRSPSTTASNEPQPDRRAAPASAQEGEEAGKKYDFYEMLPKFEVVVPEREKVTTPGARSTVRDPGAYVLQAGSYRNFKDADRMRAQLALQGIESRVEKVVIGDQDTWHRVRIGPITDLDELNRVSDKLHQADIDSIMLRVGD